MKRTLAALFGAFTLVAAGPLAPSTAATPSITPGQVTTGFSGIAYGSYIFNSDKTLTSGPTANSSIGCTGLTGLTSTNSAAALNVPAVGAVGAAATSVRTLETATGKRIEGRSVVGSANLLGGLITAGTISSVSIADKNTAGAFSGTNQTNIANLKVLGLPVAANPAPNTVIDLNVPLLGSLGKITLNGQEKKLVNGTYQVSTTALRVEVLKAGIAGVKAGTDIRLGVSLAKLTPAQVGYAAGAGFTTKSTLATGLLGSGPTAYASLSCSAGTQTVNLAGTTLTGLATVGASTTTTTTVVSPALKGTVTNSLAGLNVLSGVIQADAIKAETSASRATAGGVVTLTDTSTFTNLRITGLPAINASVAPNTVVQVPGLGKVTLHKVTKTSAAIVVTMVEIVLNQSIGGLPTGSTIQIGYSNTGIRN
ncbi:choice-of-anchor P family protein [Arthrobacter silvisoli]|uniref:choice-of-anchor P family protein n=1 Tax=Arthrobacter silvisoli TaxID=2291022 RepID=UPI001443F11A|nr:choice-of-anchor P family protein [Arthrobacter silvisoli]